MFMCHAHVGVKTCTCACVRQKYLSFVTFYEKYPSYCHLLFLFLVVCACAEHTHAGAEMCTCVHVQQKYLNMSNPLTPKKLFGC